MLSVLVAASKSFMISEDRNLSLLTPKEAPGSQQEREDGSGAADGQHRAQHGPRPHLRGGTRQPAPKGSPAPTGSPVSAALHGAACVLSAPLGQGLTLGADWPRQGPAAPARLSENRSFLLSGRGPQNSSVTTYFNSWGC